MCRFGVESHARGFGVNSVRRKRYDSTDEIEIERETSRERSDVDEEVGKT